MSSNPFAALTGAGQHSGARPARKSRAGGVAGATLKRAGLVDEDLGMRDVSSAGPSRAARGRGGHAGESNGSRSGDGRAGHKARARANPMGSRPPRGSQDPMVTGQAFGIRGASRGRGKGAIPVADLIRNGGQAPKGKGRMPGGGGPDESLLARMEGGRATGAAPQQTTGKTIASLKQFLKSRFIQDAQFLNLESMATDPGLLREDVKPPGTAGAHKDIGSVMWKLCREMFPNIITLSLAKNDLKSLTPVSTLPEFLPDLKNLSLQDNDIKWVRDLAFHQARSRGSVSKFNSLHELILTGNPVHDNALSAGNEQGYRAEVLGRFPDLRMLDQKPVSETEHGFAQLPGAANRKDQVGIAQGAANAGVEVRDFPLAIPHGNFVDEHAEGVVPPFLAKFFDMFDMNRESLRAAYSSDATFSIITISAVPPRARSAGYINKLPRQKDLSWKPYRDVMSHNVMQLGTRPASKGFPRGPGAILATFNKLPKTTHPLTDPSKFAYDAWLLPNKAIGASMASTDGGNTKPDALLFISVHGEFAEAPSQGVRSFSRCFVVAPVLPGSQAANLGWPCVIISDQLTVRQYAGTAAWDKDAATALNGATPSTSSNQASSDVPAGNNNAVMPGLTPEQNALVVQLSGQTGLTMPFALQCLSDNEWNPQLALERFQALKASGAIPAEAFMAVGQ